MFPEVDGFRCALPILREQHEGALLPSETRADRGVPPRDSCATQLVHLTLEANRHACGTISAVELLVWVGRTKKRQVTGQNRRPRPRHTRAAEVTDRRRCV